MDDQLSALAKEIEFFTSFNFPESVRAVANDAVKLISKKEIAIPMTTSASPVMRAINTVLTNPKLARSSETFLSGLIQTISGNIYGPEPLKQIVSGVTAVSQELNFESALTFIKAISSGMMTKFPHLDLICASLSIVLSLMSHREVIISSSAFAAFPQIFNTLVTNLNECQTFPDEYTETCTARYKETFTRFAEPKYFILFLLLGDMTSMALGHALTWLNVPKPVATVFDLLELIIDEHKDMLNSVPELLCLFEGAVIQALNDQNALQFVISFMHSFLETHGSLCVSVFSDYLVRVSVKSKGHHVALFFFRSIVTRSKDFAAKIFSLYDTDNSMSSPLIKNLLMFIEASPVSSPIEFSLIKSRLNILATEESRQKFVLSAPYEICFGLLASLESLEDPKMKEFLRQSATMIVKILTYASGYASESSFSLVCDAARALLTITLNNKLYKPYKALFPKVCSLQVGGHVNPSDWKKFSIKEKTTKYRRFLRELSAERPDMFDGLWSNLFRVLFVSSGDPPENYGKNFTEKQLTDAIRDMASVKPLQSSFVAKVIAINHERFMQFWPELEKVFDTCFGKKGAVDIELFGLFVALLSECLMDESEEKLLELGARFVGPESPLVLEQKMTVLQQIRQTLLAESVSVIKAGWTHMFAILNPANYEQDLDALQTSMGCLNIVCNNNISYVPQTSLPACIKLIFSFASSTTAINISLSSFDHLWVVVRVMDNTTDNWTLLVQEVINRVHDPRSDISQCAMRTIGSLLSSNHEQVPADIFSWLISDALPKLLVGFSTDNQKIMPDLQLALQELAHYTATFWHDFEGSEHFMSDYIPQLIKKQTEFSLKCTSYELVTVGFAFYEEFFRSDVINEATENILRDSVAELADHFMSFSPGQASIIFSCFGKTMGTIIQTLKDRNVTDTLPLWFPIIEKIVTTCKSIEFVHITVQRTLDALPYLFPMSEETTFKTVDLLLQFASNRASPALPEYISQLLCNIWKSVQDEFKARVASECRPLFAFPVSESLMKSILENSVKYDNSCAVKLFESYQQMAITCPQLRSKVNERIVELFDKVDPEAQVAFIEANKKDFELLSLIWTTYFDGNSPTLDMTLYGNCFDVTLSCVSELLADDKQTVTVLKFLENVTTPSRVLDGKASDRWFMLRLMPTLANLSNHASGEVRGAVQQALVSMSSYVAKLF